MEGETQRLSAVTLRWDAIALTDDRHPQALIKAQLKIDAVKNLLCSRSLKSLKLLLTCILGLTLRFQSSF